VEALLGVVEAEGDDLLDGVGGLFQGDAEVGALAAGEVGQDEVGGVLAARWAADAHAQARVVLGGDGLADGAQAVVTAFSPTGFGALVIGTIRWWWIGVWALMLAAALYYEVWILGITALVGTLLFNLLVAAHFRRRFGGLNGDCIGASIELCTAFSAALVAVLL